MPKPPHFRFPLAPRQWLGAGDPDKPREPILSRVARVAQFLAVVSANSERAGYKFAPRLLSAEDSWIEDGILR